MLSKRQRKPRRLTCLWVEVYDIPPLRQAYIDEVAALRGAQKQWSGVDKEIVAREMYAKRRGLGMKNRNLPPSDIPEKT